MADVDQTNVSATSARFWWVNHKQTSRQEIDGDYLWSPVKERSGNRSQFYDNMRRARPGEFVISYANAQVGHVGCVVDFAIDSAKPTDFGTKGAYWDEFGWLLPVDWTPVPTTVRPADHLEQIVIHLPEKYSPINANTGFGNQKAYLAEISYELFSYILAATGATMSFLDNLKPSAASSDHRALAADAIEAALLSDATLSATERAALIQSRRGQGVFRSKVMNFESKCRITGLSLTSLLVASHIKPWRSCLSAAERLDGCNGLLLSPHVDLLFDLGFISFADNGAVLVSCEMSTRALEQLGLDKCRAQNVGAFLPRQREYLQYHREHVFIV